jgi:carboxypeptidase Q
MTFFQDPLRSAIVKLILAPRLFSALFLLPLLIGAEDKVDLYTLHRIRAEAVEHSQVMENLFYLTDVHGPRLANSPNYFAAADWVVKQMASYGIHAKEEKWGPFGTSWRYTKFYAAMTSPQYQPLIGFPLAWSKGTGGPVSAEAVYAPIFSDADMDKWRGKLKGKVVLASEERTLRQVTEPLSERWTADELAKEETFPPSPGKPGPRRGVPEAWRTLSRDQIREMRKKINKFLADEGVAAVLSPSYGDGGGTVFGAAAGSREAKDPVAPPSVVLTPEHYNRILRLIQHKIPVKLDLDVEAEIFPSRDAVNVIAELPGTTRQDEIVMIGAHLDSWHGGTGATDNAAGSAVMMEVMRILKTLDLKLTRTVRMALWDGEEEGLLGSKAYVKEHFGDPATMKLTAEQAKLDAYYNLDNGSGRIRGIYLQGNDMARPIFEQWLAPFRDMSAGALTIRNTDGTDHLSFDAVGLPGFQFIQDTLDYDSRTHHSNMDTYERLSPDDLKQAAAIIASFVYNTAIRDQMMPRKPLPAPHSNPEQKPGGNIKATGGQGPS